MKRQKPSSIHPSSVQRLILVRVAGGLSQSQLTSTPFSIKNTQVLVQCWFLVGSNFAPPKNLLLLSLASSQVRAPFGSEFRASVGTMECISISNWIFSNTSLVYKVPLNSTGSLPQFTAAWIWHPFTDLKTPTLNTTTTHLAV